MFLQFTNGKNVRMVCEKKNRRNRFLKKNSVTMLLLILILFYALHENLKPRVQCTNITQFLDRKFQKFNYRAVKISIFDRYAGFAYRNFLQNIHD